MKRKYYLAALAALSATAIGSAHAAKAEGNDAHALTAAKISLVQAVTTAEQHAGGKASHVEFEKSRGLWVFDVEVVTARSVMDVKVDATTGRIVAAAQDETDRDDRKDAED